MSSDAGSGPAAGLSVNNTSDNAASTPAPSVNNLSPQPSAAGQGNSVSNNSGGTTSAGKYRNGVYTGEVADAYYGNIQVQVTISQGKISDVQFLQYPNDNRTSRFINSQAMPMLKSEAIAAQNAQVDIVSGASASSQAFVQSLQSALAKAS